MGRIGLAVKQLEKCLRHLEEDRWKGRYYWIVAGMEDGLVGFLQQSNWITIKRGKENSTVPAVDDGLWEFVEGE